MYNGEHNLSDSNLENRGKINIKHLIEIIILYFFIPVFFYDNTHYQTPLRLWLLLYMISSTVDLIIKIFRINIINKYIKRILTFSIIINYIFFIRLIIMGFVWYQQEDKNGIIKLIIIIFCSYRIIIWGRLLILICYLIVSFTLSSDDSTKTLNRVNIETIEKFTNIYLYSDFFESNKDKFNEIECCICSENYIKNDEIRLLVCNHYFHKKCVTEWLKITKTCPYCRQEIDNIVKVVKVV